MYTQIVVNIRASIPESRESTASYITKYAEKPKSGQS